MSSTKSVEVPAKLVLTSMLTCSITLCISVTYTVLSILVLVYRFQCDEENIENFPGSSFIVNSLYRTYIQADDCVTSVEISGLTSSYSVFILTIVTLVTSFLGVVTAITVMTLTKSETRAHNLHLAAYAHVAVYVAGLVVDITFATHFGIDYTNLSEQLDLSSAGLGINYELDAIRVAALFLMAITLKVFVYHAVNVALVILFVNYTFEYEAERRRHGVRRCASHPIHKMGVLSAYDQPKPQDPWQHEPSMFFRGPQSNPSYIEEPQPPRSPRREPPPPSDYSRSESWQPSGAGSARPFSYLEESKRGARSAPVPPSPAGETQWRRDWLAPHVPAPDYSPPNQRRLKSALKPNP